MATSDWDPITLRARIEDGSGRRRYAGGSPDETEIAAYATALPSHLQDGTALILGMTPELRRLALRGYRSIVSVDINPQAIALYRDWIEPPDPLRERIVQADWMTLADVVAMPVQAVLGDGVFGNVLTLDAHKYLLRQNRPNPGSGRPLRHTASADPRWVRPGGASRGNLVETVPSRRDR
jgi:hypothetical protein